MGINVARFKKDAKRFVEQLDKGVVKHVNDGAVQAFSQITISIGKTLGVPVPQGGHPLDTGVALDGWEVRRANALGEAAVVFHEKPDSEPYLHFVEFGTTQIQPRLWITSSLMRMGLSPDWFPSG